MAKSKKSEVESKKTPVESKTQDRKDQKRRVVKEPTKSFAERTKTKTQIEQVTEPEDK